MERVIPTDPYAPFKNNAWREMAAIDERLERGEIDEAGWYDEVSKILVPKYLAATTPWGQSGRTGTLDDWHYSRSFVADAIDRDGAFLDVGCANGFLMECLPQWTAFAVEPYGLDIAPEFADLARRRLPHWADRIFVGNALTWAPPRRFTTIRTGLYAPARRRRDLVEHLLSSCERLIIGVFNEQAHERPTEDIVRSWGFPVSGRSERPHRTKPGMAYRCFWIDAR